MKKKKEEKVRKGKEVTTVKTLWLPISDDENNLMILPLTPKSNRFSKEPLVLITEIGAKINLIRNNNNNNNNDYNNNISESLYRLIQNCLDILVELEDGWLLKPIAPIYETDKIISKVLKYQNDHFFTLEEGYLIFLKYAGTANAMPPAPQQLLEPKNIINKIEELIRVSVY